MKTLCVIALGVLTLTACGAASDVQSVSTLQSMQKQQEQGKYAELANRPVPDGCTSQPVSDTCKRIFAIRAQACLMSARRLAAAQSPCPDRSDKSVELINCAVEGYDKAQGVTQDPGQLSNLAANQAHALYCGAEFELDERKAASLAQAAQAALSGVPDTAQNALIAASAALFIVQQPSLPASDRCRAARDAGRWAAKGLAVVQVDASVTANLKFSLNEARRQAGQFNGCEGI